jgi:hypothetical protein
MDSEKSTAAETAEAPDCVPTGLLGTGIRETDGSLTCAACGYDCEWTECQDGCDDGYFDGYDEDPLWYDPGDLRPCCECGGQGGIFWCENPKCDTQDIRKIISRAQVPNRYSAAPRAWAHA